MSSLTADGNAQSEGEVFPNGFLWRTITTCLLLFDYFLFSTGNPSLLCRFLGGFSWLILFAIAMIVSTYVPPSFSGKEARPFWRLLSIVGVFSAVLFFASPYANELAANRMETQILLFIKDPEDSKVDALYEERQLMINLARQKYDKERGAFIPTVREMDYYLKTEAGEKYLVRIRMSWDGTPVISVRSVNS